MAKKIYLSPSNQSKNIYAYGKTNEMAQCNKIAESCEVYLKKLGFEVKRAPMGQSMNTSINESNAWDADVHICIHTNAGGGRGCEVFTHKGTSSQLKYAKPVYEALSALTTNSDRGLKTANFAELSRTNAICVYCECEFHDNETYAKWIVEHTDELGLAIANGIAKADGKNSVTYHLDQCSKGIYIPAGTWRHLMNFATNSTALIITSTKYSPKDYIRDYAQFVELKKNRLL